MKHYEIVFLVHPDQSDQVPSMTKRVVALVKDSGGKVHRSEDWKRRQLAYPIAKVHKAHYLLMNVECSLDSMDQIREYFRYNEAVLRSMILDIGRQVTVPSPIRPTEAQEEAEMDKEQASQRLESEMRAEGSDDGAAVVEGGEDYEADAVSATASEDETEEAEAG